MSILPTRLIKWVTVAAAILLCHSKFGHGLKCFACSYQFNLLLLDYECVENPAEVRTGDRVLDCDGGEVCYTNLVRFFYPRKEIDSMQRSCGPARREELTGCIQADDGTKETCHYQCDVDYCNNINGLDETKKEGTKKEEYKYPEGVLSNAVDKSGWYRVWVNNGSQSVKGYSSLFIITILCTCLTYVK